ncbi:MAG: rRNA maturation RNase YbeY [Pseudobdellovibrionaceae bacterium]
MLQLINQSQIRMPRKWLEQCYRWMALELKLKKDLTLVFLNPIPARKLNSQYRKKNYATDVLSFSSDIPSELGELIMCPQVLQKQAQEHGHSFRAELAYMLIHGVLHLQGYDHEKSKAEAKKMFQIQDQLFDRLCSKFHI